VNGLCPCDLEIDTDQIRKHLGEFAGPVPDLPPGRTYRAAAVLVPLVCVQGEWYLLYTKRTELVPNHKGQVSFPGGAVEAADSSREETALRETWEELGVEREAVDILGHMWDMPTITGFVITPVVGWMAWPVELHPEPNEVSRAFIVPLRWLADPTNREEKELILPDGRHERALYFNLFDGEKIWGATARITLNFLRIIGWVSP
jgi:8-oxo-dGTP pyrophosphatase MutT (NUDIX family)